MSSRLGGGVPLVPGGATAGEGCGRSLNVRAHCSLSGAGRIAVELFEAPRGPGRRLWGGPRDHGFTPAEDKRVRRSETCELLVA
jgi:hypothetical protein